MSISSRYKKFFRAPVTADKLALFQSIFEAREMTAHLALALLKVIHRELSANRNSDPILYKRYAGTIESVRHNTPDILREVVLVWNSQQSAAPEEWFADRK
ncbi:MAG: hypothetical protein HYZ23_04625 [Chloroflexi bacterium]|nr:hypothetical protein [Chloroflexota bacterium]